MKAVFVTDLQVLLRSLKCSQNYKDRIDGLGSRS